MWETVKGWNVKSLTNVLRVYLRNLKYQYQNNRDFNHLVDIGHSNFRVMKSFNIGTMLKLGIPYLIFFFTPIAPLVLAVGFLSLMDTVTGVSRAKKAGEKIHSSKLTRTITKMVFYAIAIILARLMEIHFIPWMPIAQITAGYIALVEFKSNMENIGELTGINIWNTLKDKLEGLAKGNRK